MATQGQWSGNWPGEWFGAQEGANPGAMSANLSGFGGMSGELTVQPSPQPDASAAGHQAYAQQRKQRIHAQNQALIAALTALAASGALQ